MIFFNNLKPLCFIEQQLLLSKNRNLLLYDFKSRILSSVGSLASGSKYSFFSKNKLLSRLFRRGIQYAIELTDKSVLIVVDRKLIHYDITTKEFHTEFILPRGRRPLSICRVQGIDSFDDGCYFGEYFENNDKKPVHIYHRFSDGKWKQVYTFSEGEIDHVHALIPDPYSQHVWVLTGDFEDGAAIWIATNNFERVTRVVSGKQTYRSSAAFPTPQGLLYATDSQFEENSIRLLHKADSRQDPKKETDGHLESKNNWISKHLHTMNGPCIFASFSKNRFYFSNSVEPDGRLTGNRIRDIFEDIFFKKPGSGNLSAESTVVSIDKYFNIEEIARYKKDLFPMGLFQFGNIQFPSGQQADNKLVSYNIALTRHDLTTIIQDV